MVLTLWQDFLENEGPLLTDIVHKRPIILATRLLLSTFYGMSVRTFFNSVILFDPPISEAEHLHTWIKDNSEYIERIISEKLYDRKNEEVRQPLSSQIRKISQIKSLTEMVIYHNLSDGTDSLDATIEDKEAETLLEMSTEDLLKGKKEEFYHAMLPHRLHKPLKVNNRHSPVKGKQ